MDAPIVWTHNSARVDTVGLLSSFASERQQAGKREGRALSLQTRAALGASFLRSLLEGVAAACARARPKPSRVLIAGALCGCPPAAASLAAALARRGIDATLPAHSPLLDGALALGAAEYAGTALP
jgi:hypothetical protein